MQSGLCKIAYALNWLTLVLGIVWARHNRFWLHPLLMILAYFFLTMAMLNYRIHTTRLERTLQRMHYILIGAVAVLGYAAIHFAVKSHQKKSRKLHPLLGWIAVGLFLLQFLVGGGSISLVRRNRNHQIVRLHRILGPWIYVTVVTALLNGFLSHKCHDACAKDTQRWLVASIGLGAVCTVLGIIGSEPPHATMLVDEETARISMIV